MFREYNLMINHSYSLSSDYRNSKTFNLNKTKNVFDIISDGENHLLIRLIHLKNKIENEVGPS